MSGPIVRKYGFPNFEKIFGDRPVQHGVENEAKDLTKPEAPVQALEEDSKPQRVEKSPG
ncbi:hypothetical protein BH23PLA1_BH23PLA1_22070 [soil metagenome]